MSDFNILLLLHPTVVTDQSIVEEKKIDLLSKFPQANFNQQVINRLASFDTEIEDLTLQPAQFDLIYYVAPVEAILNKFNNNLVEKLFKLLKTNGKFTGLIPKDCSMVAIMNGFIINDDNSAWVKPNVEVVSLKRSSANKQATAINNNNGSVPLRKLPTFKRATENTPTVSSTSSSPLVSSLPKFKRVSSPPLMTDSSEGDDDTNDVDSFEENDKVREMKLSFFDDDEDDLIDENELLNDSELLSNSNIIIPIRCQTLDGGKKRRKACKDCTCGLKEKEEEEERQQMSLQNSLLSSLARSANEEAAKIEERIKRKERSKLGNEVKFTKEEVTEVDFTIEGKTGGCGSCALGDAFRCDGCPFLGLPAFRPGQVISIDSFGEDI